MRKFWSVLVDGDTYVRHVTPSVAIKEATSIVEFMEKYNKDLPVTGEFGRFVRSCLCIEIVQDRKRKTVALWRRESTDVPFTCIKEPLTAHKKKRMRREHEFEKYKEPIRERIEAVLQDGSEIAPSDLVDTVLSTVTVPITLKGIARRHTRDLVRVYLGR